jgi:hypothetical protein
MFFDTANEQEQKSFSVLPDGTYRAVIVGMAYKQTKSGTGAYLAGTFQIADGASEGRMVFQNFNIENANEKAQQIGRSQFKSLLKALGVTEALATPDDAARVTMDKICRIKVGQRVNTMNNEMQNVIKDFMADGASTPGGARKAPVTGPLDESELPF